MLRRLFPHPVRAIFSQSNDSSNCYDNRGAARPAVFEKHKSIDLLNLYGIMMILSSRSKLFISSQGLTFECGLVVLLHGTK